MLRKILVHIFILGNISSLYGQQDPVLSHYMLNPYYYSPSLVAHDGEASITALTRNQWSGYQTSFENDEGAPVTHFVNYSSLVYIKSIPFGVGGTIIYDKLGNRDDVWLQMSISHHLELPRGKISFGIRPAVINQRLDFSRLETVRPEDFEEIGQNESQYSFDLGAGISYSSSSYMVALGVDHILNPTYRVEFESGTSLDNTREIAFNLLAIYNYPFNDKIELEPSVLLRTDVLGITYDLGIRAIYLEKVWAGLSYRDSEAFSLLLGYSFLSQNSLGVGYSFDYVMFDNEYKQHTSHELFLRYNLPNLNSRDKKVIRTPRFRF